MARRNQIVIIMNYTYMDHLDVTRGDPDDQDTWKTRTYNTERAKKPALNRFLDMLSTYGYHNRGKFAVMAHSWAYHPSTPQLLLPDVRTRAQDLLAESTWGNEREYRLLYSYLALWILGNSSISNNCAGILAREILDEERDALEK